MSIRRCAYCGIEKPGTVDHVVPRALYPRSKVNSKLQRITVPACKQCNRSWVDDEVQFRNVLLTAGEPNAAVLELWRSKTRPSFGYADGLRRARDLAAQFVAVQTPQGEQYKIYPSEDARVMRIVRKVIRGLCHHHNLLSSVSDEQVSAGVQKFTMPSEFLSLMAKAHAEIDVLHYRYGVLDDEDIHSFWLLTFYERTPFFGIVFRSEAARVRIEQEGAWLWGEEDKRTAQP